MGQSSGVQWPLISRFLAQPDLKPAEHELLSHAQAQVLSEEMGTTLRDLSRAIKQHRSDGKGEAVRAFISYAWGDEGHAKVARLVKDLEGAGVSMVYDMQNNQPGTSIREFTRQIHEVNFVILTGSEQLMKKWKERGEKKSVLVDFELPEIIDRVKAEAGKPGYLRSLIPIWIDGEFTQVIPNEIRTADPQHVDDWVGVNFCADQAYDQALFGLLKGLYRTGQNPALAEIFSQQCAAHAARLQQSWQRLPLLNPAELGAVAQAAKERQHTRVTKLQALKTDLQRRYRAQSTITLLNDSDPIELGTIFVNLAIVREEEQRTKEKELQGARDQPSATERETQLGTFEDIHKPKEPIALTDLFKPRKTQKSKDREVVPQKLLLTGRAGIGKSTLCRYLAYRWAAEELLQEFDWVFHIELKRFVRDFPETKMTLAQILHRLYWPELSEAEASEAWAQMQAGGKVLFLFDGYDEIAHLQHPLTEEVLLPQAPAYMLTSRPYAVHNRRRDVDDVLENIGLTSDNVHTYVQRFFARPKVRDEAKGEKLMAWLREHPTFAALCRIPLQLELLCQEWIHPQSMIHAQERITMSLLYQAIVTRLLSRMLAKLPEAPRVEDLTSHQVETHKASLVVTAFLGDLAFHALDTGRLLIPGSLLRTRLDALTDHLRGLDSTLDVLQLIPRLLGAGFLKSSGDHKSPYENDYYFLHLSFMERFAAQHIAAHLHEPSMHAFLALHKFDPKWALVCQFTAGLLTKMEAGQRIPDTERLDLYWDILLSKPRDALGAYETHLFAQVFEQIHPKAQFANRAGLLRYYSQGVRQRNEVVLDSLSPCPGLLSAVDLQPLLDQLKDPSDHVRWTAVSALGNIQNPPEPVIQALLKGAGDKDSNVCWAAASALNKIQNPPASVIPLLLRSAGDKNSDVRRAAVEALGNIQNPPDAAIQALLKAAGDENRAVCWAAASALGDIQNLPASFIPLLLKAAVDENSGIRTAAVSALGNIQDPPAAVLRALLKAAADENDTVQHVARDALGNIQHPSGAVLQALLKAAADKNYFVRGAAVWALGNIQNPPDTVIQILRKAAGDDSGWVRGAAVQALGNIQHPSGAVLQALLKAAGDEYSSVRDAAVQALGNIQDPPAAVFQALLKAAGDENSLVRGAAAFAFGRIQDPPAAVFQALLKAAGDENFSVRFTATSALGSIQDPPAAVFQALLKAAGDENSLVRGAARDALSNIQDLPDFVIEALLRAAGDENSSVREAAVEALGNIQDPPEAVVQTLLKAAGDKDAGVSWAAAEALRVTDFCQHYPSALRRQGEYRESLGRKLWETNDALVKLGKCEFLIYQQGRLTRTRCANPNQLKRDLRSIHRLPKLVPVHRLVISLPTQDQGSAGRGKQKA